MGPGEIVLLQVVVTGLAASIGGWGGAMMLRRVNEKALRVAVVAIGATLTIGLFWQAR